ncbi:TonB-dependent siderophore receptor [Tolypothrix sp. LEGE 11397]|nr:TonB-dependent siderophore receptor [Tolypothrix sp. PCC 7601]MBE9080985.1 TonB-dependent siderophore receptor [Tolypothrix sp. LEGE 11397]UYD25386.1 TonB-dependent siderophore receptor [Tolypothrix sp. PCC 7712]UYD32370.1 TonB-dependent siderophore receptor [Tolypothrix sp. PCC 7601]BAY91320.1 TonB-dependent siderophore receptor [Microchaete diplosiphon NIES-3275]
MWSKALKRRQRAYLGILGTIVLLGTQPANAQASPNLVNNTSVPNTQIPQTNIKELLAQEQQQNPAVTIVTGVRLNSTANGLEVILETPTSDKLQTATQNEGNSFIADISNAQLRLTTGDSFRQEKPVSGVAEITVTSQDANSIRVVVVGETSPPKVELFDDDQGLVFGVTPTATSTQTPDTQQPSTETPPTQPSAQENEPIELVVTGEQDGYSVPSATTATKIEAPLRDIPQSIQVVPRQVIEDRQIVRIGETIENVSGVQELPGYGGSTSLTGYYFRGLSLAYQSLRNGFRDIGVIGSRDIANIERVEFFKGPASVLYGGRFSLGGLTNTVTKKPLEEPYYNIGATIGSYDFYRPTLDISGPLTSDRSLLYRLNLAYQNSGSFRDFNENESFFVAPAITWKISPKTSLTVELEQQNYNYTFDYNFPPEREVFQLPISRFLGEPNFNDATFNSTSVSYNFEHKFTDTWKFRQGFSAIMVNADTRQVELFDPLGDDRRTLPRSPLRTEESQEDYVLQNEIFGEFKTGSIQHKILVGLELSRWGYDFNYFRGTLDPIDIFNPQYGAQATNFEQELHRKQSSDNLGIYIQDFIELASNLKLLAGVRFDVNDASVVNQITNTTINQQTTSRFSPRVGIVYQPSSTTSLYFNWANSFNPQFFRVSRTGEQFDPTTGEQFEVGVKQDFLNNRLSATLALYQIKQQNVLTTDLADPRFSIATGEQTSRGVELDIAGELLPGWKIIANYAYANGFVSRDNSIPEGDRIAGIPSHSASLWTTYELQKGNLQGLGFGLGLVYASEREAQLPNTFTLPSYVRVDAALSYRRDNFKVGLNFRNLFDTKYYNTDTFYIYPQAPLTVLGTVSVQF